TPEFMSPEQAQGKTLDARSDIYSLAVILYEVLTGKLPFDAKTPMEYIQKHVMDAPIPLKDRTSERSFPAGLQDVLFKALAKKPEDRYQSAAKFAQALKPFAGHRSGAYVAPASGAAASPAPEAAAPSPLAAPSAGPSVS